MRGAAVAAVILALGACRHHDDPAESRIVIGSSPEPISNAAPPDAGPDADPYDGFDPTLDSQSEGAPEDNPAMVHFERGQRAYDLGNYADAIDEFKLAYELQPLPPLLYNIAMCYRQLGDRTNAIFFFKRYLALDPDARNRRDVEDRIKELEQQP